MFEILVVSLFINFVLGLGCVFFSQKHLESDRIILQLELKISNLENEKNVKWDGI